MHPRCFKCGTESEGSVFNKELQIWGTGQLLPLPNMNGDQHLYMCKECKGIGTESSDSWINTDPRFYRATTPHADNKAFLEYRKQYMGMYRAEFREKLLFKPKIYKGKRSGREYIIMFVNESNLDLLLPQLKEVALVREEDYSRKSTCRQSHCRCSTKEQSRQNCSIQ